MRRRNANILRSISRLAHAEKDFLNQEFLAPVVRGRKVSVRIAGVVCAMQIDPSSFRGWGIFLPITPREAMLDRDATLAQRQMYLKLFTRVRLIVVQAKGAHAIAMPANPGDARFQIDGNIRVDLVDDVDTFDSILARFDGQTFWFDQLDESADPTIASHLRRCLIDLIEPKAIERPGLTMGQRIAYSHAYAARLREMPAYRNENRLREALAHAGAALRDFSSRGDAFHVSFDLDGVRHVSVVRQNDLTVQSSGICLSGRDRDFDLASLVSVLREGNEQ